MTWLLSTVIAITILILPACKKHSSDDDGPSNGSANSTQAESDAAARQAALRYLSFSIRDIPPTASEAQNFGSNATTIDSVLPSWLDSPEHLLRMKRYFTDLLGVSGTAILLPTTYDLTKDSNGVYQLTDTRMARPACSPSDAVSQSAWWLEPGQTIQVCKSIVSSTLQPTSTASGTAVTLKCAGIRAFADPACGCGPAMIACYPTELAPTIRESVKAEFGERGAFVYKNRRSWQDLLGGNFLYANRFLAWWYLYTTKIGPLSVNPTTDELAALAAIPTDSFVEANFPTFVTSGVTDGNLRAGVITSPGFLAEFNTFRARIHGLVMALLCKDVDGSLGNDISTYNNPNFTAFDRSHGVKAECSGCHYPMDNMASLDFGWNTYGYLDTKMISARSGHAFGSNGTGPAFLATAFIDHAPEFKTCMAKTAWQNFSGLNWESLSTDQKTALGNAVADGPYATINAVLSSSMFRQARTNGAGTTSNASSSNLDFTKDITPILTNSCGGSSCHSTGAPNPNLLQDETMFRGLADKVATRIHDGGGMPPANSGKSLSDSDRQQLLKFLGK